MDAITAVESLFGVTLDTSDAGRWSTAGDVFKALLKALPDEERGKHNLWECFRTALTRETGVDPSLIELNSPLLAERIHLMRPTIIAL